MNRFHRWYCRTGHWRHVIQDQILPWALNGIDLGGRVLEVGPGPGLTTDILANRTTDLTALEIDPKLAAALRRRLDHDHVTVEQGDATAMPFEDASFDTVVCFTMLHHVPSAELQDRLLTEARRVLRPGGTFAGSDSRASVVFRVAHVADTMILVAPDTFDHRLRTAGFDDVAVEIGTSSFRFRAVAPGTDQTDAPRK